MGASGRKGAVPLVLPSECDHLTTGYDRPRGLGGVRAGADVGGYRPRERRPPVRLWRIRHGSVWAPFVESKRERPRPRRTFRSNLRESLRPVRMVATEASDFCKRSARVRPMSFVAYPRARECE